jgi:hypothetical protein
VSVCSTNGPQAAYILWNTVIQQRQHKLLCHQLDNSVIFRKLQSWTYTTATKLERVTEFRVRLIPELLTVAWPHLLYWLVYLFCPFLRVSVQLQMQGRNHNITAMWKHFEESYKSSMDPLFHSILWISILIEWGVAFCKITEIKSNPHSSRLPECYVGH